MSIVVCKLPKAGLGNQLFPLMNAVIFSKLNNLPLVVIGYHQLKIGPYLRKEKTKRKYSDYFTFQKSLLGEVFDRIRVTMLSKKFEQVYEPVVAGLQPHEVSRKIFFFEKLPRYHDYFVHLKKYRNEVRSCLMDLLQPWILEAVQKMRKPVIGVHIRMGDFRALKTGEDFSKVGHVRTPEKYFIDIIETIRTINADKLPVMLFTDGYRAEFKELFAVEGIQMIEGNPDIIDLLLLSKSRILLMANGSTFSYWAGFLADAAIIKHPDHLYAAFRPDTINERYYEGPLLRTEIPKLLESNIREIKREHPTCA